MGDILIQFHALPEEISSLVEWVVAEFGVHVTGFRFFPFRCFEVASGAGRVVVEDASIREIALTLEPPVIAAKGMGEFLDLNPGALVLAIGRRSDLGLSESSLSSRTEDERALRAWKAVAMRLKATTQAGAIAVNRETGAVAKLRRHRYTPGAKALDMAGVAILPVAGASVMHLNDDLG